MTELSPIEALLMTTLMISGVLLLLGALVRVSEVVEKYLRLRRTRRNMMMEALKARRIGK
jgi:hypothetical protein